MTKKIFGKANDYFALKTAMPEVKFENLQLLDYGGWIKATGPEDKVNLIESVFGYKLHPMEGDQK